MFTESDQNKDAQPICVVVGGENNGDIIYTTEDYSTKSVLKGPAKTMMTVDKPGQFEVMPSDIRIINICGSQKSGKSYFAGQYIQKYRKIYPKSSLYIISRLDSDPALDYLKGTRIIINDEYLDNPLEFDQFPVNSICLFDDTDNFTNKNLQKAVNKLKEQIMECGRKMNIRIIICSHLISGPDRNMTRITLNEMEMLVVFPKSGSIHPIRACLNKYYGLTNVQINNVLKLDKKSRWLCVTKAYPQVILTQNVGIFVNAIPTFSTPDNYFNF